MIIQLSKTEFQELRKIIVGLNNQNVTREFNKIFNKSENSDIIGIADSINHGVMIVMADEKVVLIENIIAENAPTVTKLSKVGLTITSASKWINLIKKVFNDIKVSLNKKKES